MEQIYLKHEAKEQRAGEIGTSQNYLEYLGPPEIAEIFSSNQPDTYASVDVDQGKIFCIDVPQDYTTEPQYVYLLVPRRSSRGMKFSVVPGMSPAQPYNHLCHKHGSRHIAFSVEMFPRGIRGRWAFLGEFATNERRATPILGASGPPSSAIDHRTNGVGAQLSGARYSHPYRRTLASTARQPTAEWN